MPDKKYIPTNETYTLKTVDDFMALSTEQFEMMLPDFLEWKKTHDFMKRVEAMAKAVDPEADIQFPDYFEWIDDGLNDCTSTIEIKDPETGPSIEIKNLQTS